MQRVGIITIHRSNNYGACLQSFGLYKFLKNHKYGVEIIDLHRPVFPDYIPSKTYVPFRVKKTGLLRKILNQILKRKKKNLKKSSMSVQAQTKFDVFNDVIKMSHTFKGIDELYENPPSYDTYITGSDQLWNPTIGFCIEPYFLTFVNNGAKKISYATSVGINELEVNEKSLFASWLKSYNHISVREKSAQLLLKSFCDYPIEQVSDPSFLLDREEWRSMAVKPVIQKPYILLFTLSFSPELLEFAKKMKKGSGLELVYLCLGQPAVEEDFFCERNAGPNEWLGYIANAEMVFTDSFHGTVFSIIMQAKNFFTYVPSTQKRGTRITDLLTTYGIENHSFAEENLSDPYTKFASLKIDLHVLTDIFLKEQERSRDYLINAIEN